MDKANAIKRLKPLLKPFKGHQRTVYYVVHDISRSGMRRRMSFYVINRKHDRMECLDGCIHDLDIGYPRHKSEDGLDVKGGNMNMGFAVVNAMCRAVFNSDGNEVRNERL